MNFKRPEGQMARWLEELATYDFVIEHRAGRVHNNADALSRRPCSSDLCTYCERVEKKYEYKDVKSREDPVQKEVCNLSDNVTGASNVELSETADESDMTIVVKSEHKFSAVPKPLNLLSNEVGSSSRLTTSTSDNKDELEGTIEHVDVDKNLIVNALRSAKSRGTEEESEGYDGKVDIDLLKRLQRTDEIIGTLIEWKEQNLKPTWSNVSKHSIELKYY